MALFTEESDEDSIATDTTADSDHDEDEGFSVERILNEKVDEESNKEWLVKWAGYPLYRCSYEPRSQFESDVSIQAWEQAKREAARGSEPLFDMQKFYDAVEQYEDAKDVKAARRAAKRAKRGEVSSVTSGKVVFVLWSLLISGHSGPIITGSATNKCIKEICAGCTGEKKRCCSEGWH